MSQAEMVAVTPTTLTLANLPKGVIAKIKLIEFDEGIRARLAHIGLLQDETVSVVRPSVGKSPLMVRTQGAYLMVRYQDAQKIYLSYQA